jgi:hypothetical protein
MGDHGGEHGAALLGLHYLPIALFLLLLVLDQGSRRGLPLAERFLTGVQRLSPALRLALLLVLVSATVHLSLVPGHVGQPVTAALFLLDAAAEVGICVLACWGLRHWRQLGAALMVANLVAYAAYLLPGLEQPDGIGVATKLVELAALAVLSLSARETSVLEGMEITSS